VSFIHGVEKAGHLVALPLQHSGGVPETRSMTSGFMQVKLWMFCATSDHAAEQLVEKLITFTLVFGAQSSLFAHGL